MGNGVSSIECGAHETAMGDLPESCVARVLMEMGPAEICRLAKLNRTFRAAAAADFIWAAKLPENYEMVAGRVLGEEERGKVEGRGKKEVYSRLCRHNFFDGGTKV